MKIPAVSLRALATWWQRRRGLLLFGVALGFGALAMLGTRGYISERVEAEKERLVPRRAMVPVVVARHDLERGALVAPENMAVRDVPADYLPGSAILPDRFERHVGARLDAPMRSGEPLLAGAIVGADAGGFSGRIRQGIRAMSVLVDEVNSVSGMLQPGDRIDLLFSVRPPTSPGQPPAQEVTAALMQDLPVLATGRQVRAGGDDAAGTRHFTAITVEVSPEQAQRLIVAQRTGKLTAMLRHPDDRQPLGQRALDLNALLGIAPAVVPPPPAAVRPGPEIIVGGRGTLVAMRAAPATGVVSAATLSALVPPASTSGTDAPAEPASMRGDDSWSLHRFATPATR
jgi:pilus assembly protein CpaB